MFHKALVLQLFEQSRQAQAITITRLLNRNLQLQNPLRIKRASIYLTLFHFLQAKVSKMLLIIVVTEIKPFLYIDIFSQEIILEAGFSIQLSLKNRREVFFFLQPSYAKKEAETTKAGGQQLDCFFLSRMEWLFPFDNRGFSEVQCSLQQALGPT